MDSSLLSIYRAYTTTMRGHIVLGTLPKEHMHLLQIMIALHSNPTYPKTF